MIDKITVSGWPCRKPLTITTKYIVDVIQTDYGSLIKSIITAPGFNNRLAYFESYDTVQLVLNKLGKPDGLNDG